LFLNKGLRRGKERKEREKEKKFVGLLQTTNAQLLHQFVSVLVTDENIMTPAPVYDRGRTMNDSQSALGTKTLANGKD
jgi:hypothetical protein